MLTNSLQERNIGTLRMERREGSRSKGMGVGERRRRGREEGEWVEGCSSWGGVVVGWWKFVGVWERREMVE